MGYFTSLGSKYTLKSSMLDQRDGIPVEDSWCRKGADHSLSICR